MRYFQIRHITVLAKQVAINIQHSGIFKMLVHSEPWHIQSPGIFKTLAYLEPWYIQDLKHTRNPVKHLR